MLVGGELGVIEGRYQPMKIAAAEAAGQASGVRGVTPARLAAPAAAAGPAEGYTTAIGLTGEPVPRRSRSGAITQKNDQRPVSSQSGTRSSNCR